MKKKVTKLTQKIYTHTDLPPNHLTLLGGFELWFWNFLLWSIYYFGLEFWKVIILSIFHWTHLNIYFWKWRYSKSTHYIEIRCGFIVKICPSLFLLFFHHLTLIFFFNVSPWPLIIIFYLIFPNYSGYFLK